MGRGGGRRGVQAPPRTSSGSATDVIFSPLDTISLSQTEYEMAFLRTMHTYRDNNGNTGLQLIIKTCFLIFQPKHNVLGTQKNYLDETVQNQERKY